MLNRLTKDGKVKNYMEHRMYVKPETVAKHLSAYEDTGLTPEEIVNLKEALSLCAFSLKHALLNIPEATLSYMEEEELLGKNSPELAELFVARAIKMKEQEK